MTRVFSTGATRDSDDNKLDIEGFFAPRVLLRHSIYMHECRLRDIPEGQELRSSDNWQKGMPRDALMKSLLRHVFEAWAEHREGTKQGKEFEDTFCAILFNAQAYLNELLLERDVGNANNGC